MAKVRKMKVRQSYHLELSKEEFFALYFVLRRIGGSPRSSPRRFTQKILDEFGPLAPTFDYCGEVAKTVKLDQTQKSIWFEDNTIEAFKKALPND